MKVCPGCGAMESHGCVIDLQDLPRVRHLAYAKGAMTLLCLGHERPYWLVERTGKVDAFLGDGS